MRVLSRGRLKMAKTWSFACMLKTFYSLGVSLAFYLRSAARRGEKERCFQGSFSFARQQQLSEAEQLWLQTEAQHFVCLIQDHKLDAACTSFPVRSFKRREGYFQY